MSSEEMVMYVAMIPLGLLELGLIGYMYDQLQKDILPKKFKKLDIISRLLFPILPVLFMKKSVRERSIKGMIVFALFCLVPIVWIIIGYNVSNKY